MKSGFLFSSDNKRYHTFNHYLRQTFGKKVVKVAINAGMTCPNRDGTKGFGGCTYCSDSLSGDFGGNPEHSLKQQFYEVREITMKKWDNAVYIVYFQAGTNTNAPVEYLKKLYYEALTLPDVVGISIATRPDCIDQEIADLLCELSQRTWLMVELGLQTIHDETAKRINRCHSYDEFEKGYSMLLQKGIKTCIHIINGLPGEDYAMMIKTARAVAKLHPQSIKIHLLHIIKGTRLHQQYENKEFSEMKFDDYINTVCDQLEIIPPDIIIQRLTGDGDRNSLVAPLWSLKKLCVLNAIDKELSRRNSFQGSKYKPD